MMSMDRTNKKGGAQHAQPLVKIFCCACIFLSSAQSAEKYIDALAAETAFPFGNGFLLFISKNGDLSSVGKNSSGQLGIGTMLDALVATQIGGGYAAISKGIDHSVGLKANGDVWAWGGNVSGELGDGTTSNRLIPTKIGDAYRSIATGDIFTLGLKANGEVWSWGNNKLGQLGVNRFEQLGSTTIVPFFTPTPVLVGGNFRSIAAGYSHGLAIKENGDLWAWGVWNSASDNRIGVANGNILPGKIGSDFISAAAGDRHTLGIKRDGSLWGWGHGWAAGAVTPNGLLAQSVKLGTAYKAVKAGVGLSVALKEDGTLEMWGEGGSADGFNGSINPELIAPTPRAIGKDFVALLDVGGGLKSDGSLWFWGEPQLPSTGATRAGLGATRSRPTQVGSDYQQVAVGGRTVLGLKTDGSLWAWGNNEFGQLGIGSTEDQYTPTLVGSGYKAVSASRSQIDFFTIGSGYGHSLALKNDGQLFAWGDNRFGQLGIGDRNERLTPTPVGHRFRTVSAGAYHSLGVKDDDTLWSWGNNQFGRLGDGTQTDKASPVLIGSGFVTAQADTERSIGIKRDGSIWVWGNWPHPVKLNGNVSIGKSPDVFLPIGKYLVPRQLSFGNAPISEIDFDRAILTTGFGAALQIEIDYAFPVNGLRDVAKLAENGRPKFVKTTSTNRFLTAPAARLLLGEDGSVWEEFFNFIANETEYTKVATGFRDIAGNKHTVAAIGTDNSLWIWGVSHHGQIPIPGIPYFTVPRHSVILDPPETQKAVCLFDWAQVVYPTLFSPPGNLHESSTAPGSSYLFRAFPGTQSYLGVADGVLYYLGPASNNTIARIGLVADWLERSACD